MNKIKQYQEFCSKGCCFDLGDERAVFTAALGLSGEAGEVVDQVKKYLEGRMDKDRLIEELGDLLWYTFLISNIFNIDVSQVIDANISKLMGRYKERYDV